jgi:hypothetical protein
MNHDHTPIIGAVGTVATALLENVNGVVSLAVGLATLGYVLTKWILLLRSRRHNRTRNLD